MQTQQLQEVSRLTSDQVLQLAEVRNDLLIRLGRLNNPMLGLKRLDEFREDLATKGILYTLEKWRNECLPSGSG